MDKVERFLVRVFVMSLVTSVIAVILANVTGTWHTSNIFTKIGIPFLFSTMGSFILLCVVSAITTFEDHRKHEADVDEHKNNLAKGGVVPPVSLAIQKRIELDEWYEKHTGERPPKPKAPF